MTCCTRSSSSADEVRSTMLVRDAHLPIIWIFGGPCTGKSSLCQRIIEKYQFMHIDCDNVLRFEALTQSSRGLQISAKLNRRERIPDEILVNILREIMPRNVKITNGYLLDNFPNTLEQGKLFETKICRATALLYLNAKADSMRKRFNEHRHQQHKNTLSGGHVPSRVPTLLDVPLRSERIEVQIRNFETNKAKILGEYENILYILNVEKPFEAVYRMTQMIINSICVQANIQFPEVSPKTSIPVKVVEQKSRSQRSIDKNRIKLKQNTFETNEERQEDTHKDQTSNRPQSAKSKIPKNERDKSPTKNKEYLNKLEKPKRTLQKIMPGKRTQEEAEENQEKTEEGLLADKHSEVKGILKTDEEGERKLYRSTSEIILEHKLKEINATQSQEKNDPQAQVKIPPKPQEKTFSKTHEKTSPKAHKKTSPKANEKKSPKAHEELSPKRPEKTSPQAHEETPPKEREETSPKAREETSPKAREETSPKARGETSPKAREETSPKERGKTSPKERGETSPKARGERSPKGHEKTSPKASEKTSPKGHEKTSPKASEKTSPKVHEKTSPKASEETFPNAREETSPKAREETSPKARGETSPKERGETSPKAPKKILPKKEEVENNSPKKNEYYNIHNIKKKPKYSPKREDKKRKDAENINTETTNKSSSQIPSKQEEPKTKDSNEHYPENSQKSE